MTGRTASPTPSSGHPLICTLEFTDHRPLYDWCLAQLELPDVAPEQTEFARLNLTHTITSKRKLRQLVEDGHVDGWDDPRMPTLRGMRRKGYPPAAIRAFMDKISVAKTNAIHDIELLESFIRTELNQTALRRMAVLDPIKLTITNWPEGEVVMVEVPNNPEDPAAGSREVPFTGSLWIEKADFELDPPPKYYRLTPGREVRLRAGFFVTATEAITDDDGNVIEVLATYDPETKGGAAPDGRKVKSTMHWVSAPTAVDAVVYEYGRLFTDPTPGADGDDVFASLNPQSRVERHAKLGQRSPTQSPARSCSSSGLGYFAADTPLDGELRFHQTVGLKDEWANIQKRASGDAKPALRRRNDAVAASVAGPCSGQRSDRASRSSSTTSLARSTKAGSGRSTMRWRRLPQPQNRWPRGGVGVDDDR
ncbi:MAG: glutamate--tRNA ligase family protein [Acidimicrobiales bacterium]